MLPTITLDRTQSLDSWCTTNSRTPSQESLPFLERSFAGPSTQRHHDLTPSCSNELLDSFFDAQETLSNIAAHDDESPSLSRSSSTIVSAASSPCRSIPLRRLEPARPRRLSSLRSQETPPSVRVYVDPVYARSVAPTTLLGNRSPRTSTTISPRHSAEPLESLGNRATSPEPWLDGSDTAMGLWGTGWNNLANWSPYSLTQERIDERSSLEDDRRSSILGSPSPSALYHDPPQAAQPPSEEAWFSQRPMYESETEPQPPRGFRSMLRHTRSAMNLGPDRGGVQRQDVFLSQTSISQVQHDGEDVAIPKRRRFDSGRGKALSRWFKKVLGDGSTRSLGAEEGRRSSHSLALSATPATKERAGTGRFFPKRAESNTAADDDSDEQACHRQRWVGADSSQRSTDWSRRPSLTSIYPRSILASPNLEASNAASASRSSCHLAPPFPPSPVTSRHVSFEDHQNGRPSLNLSEAANRRSFSGNTRGRRSSSSARPHPELCHMNSTPNLSAPFPRARCLSERSSDSYDGGVRSIASLNSNRTSFTGPRTPTSMDGGFLSHSQIFEQGPKANSRRSIEMRDARRHDKGEATLLSIRGSVRGAVEKATRSWSSLSYHAENLECEDHHGLPVVAVRRRKSSIWQHPPMERSRTLSVDATKARPRRARLSAAT